MRVQLEYQRPHLQRLQRHHLATSAQPSTAQGSKVRYTSYTTTPAQIHCTFSRNFPVIDGEASGGSRKKYLGGLAPHHLEGNHG